MSETKPELSREELIEVIKAIRWEIWEYPLFNASNGYWDKAIELANTAIDPNFEDTNEKPIQT